MWLIDRDALLGDALSYFTVLERDKNYHVFATAEVKQILADVIEAQPTIDAVPVVRCRDCKRWKTMYCIVTMGKGETLRNFYCAHGKRKDGGDTHD